MVFEKEYARISPENFFLKKSSFYCATYTAYCENFECRKISTATVFIDEIAMFEKKRVKKEKSKLLCQIREANGLLEAVFDVESYYFFPVSGRLELSKFCGVWEKVNLQNKRKGVLCFEDETYAYVDFVEKEYWSFENLGDKKVMAAWYLSDKK